MGKGTGGAFASTDAPTRDLPYNTNTTQVLMQPTDRT